MEPIWQWLVWFTLHRVTRYAASWLLALGMAALVLWSAWGSFDNEKRNDGNWGHATIDFGGQWLMGAMLARGHGEHLYDRRVQREVLEASYPYADEVPDENRPKAKQGERDAGQLMYWFMGSSRPDEAKETFGSFVAPLAGAHPFGVAAHVLHAQKRWTPYHCQRALRPHVGGPLYPPVNAFFYYPLGLLDPHDGYRLNQVLCLVYAFGAGLGVSYLTHRRFWWPLAATLILIYPGFKGAVMLGQNPPLTLLILIWGWALIARNREMAGGIVWGLLAFKPVWALAFFLVPFLTGRARVCLAMIVTGGSLAALTLPFVGVQPWYDWLEVGQEAAELYKVDENWVHLSRDLLSIPRRLQDFSLPADQRDWPEAGYWGWGLLLTVVGLTVLLAMWRFRQAIHATTGPIAAFLLLGAWMSCFHFMYYDVLLTALPMFVLFAEPRRYLDPIFLAIVRVPRDHLGEDLASYYDPGPPREHPAPVPLLKAGYRNLWVLNRMVPNVLGLLLFVEHIQPHFPFDVHVHGWFYTTHVQLQTATVEKDGQDWVIIHQRVPHLASMRITTTLWHHGQPWDTYVILFLWLWCGFLWLRTPTRPGARPWPGSLDADVVLLPLRDQPAKAVELETNIRGGHEGFADQDRPDAGRLEA